MTSAFGVDHGYVTKSYKKLRPKLGRLSQVPKKTDSFQDRMKVNYVQGRANAGYLQREVNPNKWVKEDAKNGIVAHPRTAASRERTRLAAAEKAKSRKQFAQASVDAHSANARRTRKLP